jgi:hypothetical protein
MLVAVVKVGSEATFNTVFWWTFLQISFFSSHLCFHENFLHNPSSCKQSIDISLAVQVNLSLSVIGMTKAMLTTKRIVMQPVKKGELYHAG